MSLKKPNYNILTKDHWRFIFERSGMNGNINVHLDNTGVSASNWGSDVFCTYTIRFSFERENFIVNGVFDNTFNMMSVYRLACSLINPIEDLKHK